MLNSGDKVRVKTWKEIAALGVVCGDGHIVLGHGEVFSPMMNEFCDKKYEVEERKLPWQYLNRISLSHVTYALKGITGWVFPEESLEKIN